MSVWNSINKGNCQTVLKKKYAQQIYIMYSHMLHLTLLISEIGFKIIHTISVPKHFITLSRTNAVNAITIA